MSVTESREEGVQGASTPSARRAGGPPHSPFNPQFWRSPIRGPWLTSFLGTLLVPAIAIIALTGFIGHWAFHPQLGGNGTVGPADDIPVLFNFPTWWPAWGYALSQGTHVTLGLMTLPLVLTKLWSVMPKLFRRPVASSFAGALERISLLLLVASFLMEFATGILNINDYWPWSFNFNTVHYYGAWVFGALFVLHACIKLPVVRRAYRTRGILKPLREDLSRTEPEPADGDELVSPDPAAPTISRRGLLAMVGGASLTIFAVQAGASVGGPFRRLALLAPRGRVFGTGPNDFPVTQTAASAQITPAMTNADWRLTVVGARTVSFSREQLLAMDQATRTLTITCTEGWSTTQHWAGLRLADLARLADAPAGATLLAVSLESQGGRFPDARFSHSQISDPRALLALRVNGVDLSADHGYPARVIVPNVPGQLNTKWVRELRFEAA